MSSIETVKLMARSAAFFRQADGSMLRIEYSDDDDTFHCIDEDSLEEFDIQFADVTLETEKFFELTEMKIP